MQVSLNLYTPNYATFGKKQIESPKDKELSKLLEPFGKSKEATIPPYKAMKGINPNSRYVFDTFNKLDDAASRINFVRSEDSWNDTLMEEFEEFTEAREEYRKNPSKQNYAHMEEEMGDIFFTAASIAKNSGIDGEEAFRLTNRKFYNRINLMEKLLMSRDKNKSLKDCRDYERRALWNTAKRKIYDAQKPQFEETV